MHFVRSELDCLRCGHSKRHHEAYSWSLYDVCQKPGCECAQFDPPQPTRNKKKQEVVRY